MHRGVLQVFTIRFCEKKSVFLRPFPKPVNCLCHFRPKISKWPSQGATPGRFTSQRIHLARLPRFRLPGIPGWKVILLRKKTKFFDFFSLTLGSKKLRFVHTTKLASECMCKAHILARKMRRLTFKYNHLTLTSSNFHVNRNTLPEFSQILYQQFSTFHSTLVVNYPSQASFERNWMFLTAFLFLHAYWIVSAGPSGQLKQSIQRTVFEQRKTSTRLRSQNQRSCSATAPT